MLNVKGYSLEYSDSVIKLEDTLVKWKMPNISETSHETFTKYSGFLGSSLRYHVQNMEGICPPSFWGGSGKVEPLTPYLQNGRPGGLEIFLCSWGPLILQNKILASGPGVRMVRFYVSAVHLWPLQSVLNSAARIILRKQRHDHITANICDLLHWLPVQRKIEYKMCMLVYKCLHQLAPIYLSELCIPVAATATRSHLRSAVQGNLVISYCRTKRYGQRSFAYSGPALWNSLPLTVRDPSLSLTQFCAQLKSVVFSRAQWYVYIAPPWQSRL